TIAGGRGSCAARLSFGGVTTTSGTRTAPGGDAAGVGAAGVGAARALGAASGRTLGLGRGGADWLSAGSCGSVRFACGAGESCVRPGSGTSTAPMRTTAKGKIGRCARVRAGAQRKAILARSATAIETNAASGLKHRRTDMTRSEMAALLHACEKPNGMIRDGV